MSEIKYLDWHGVHAIFPISYSTLFRLMKREVDPFPRGKLIGGKRFWEHGLSLEWLERQDDPPRVNPAVVKAQPKQAEPAEA